MLNHVHISTPFNITTFRLSNVSYIYQCSSVLEGAFFAHYLWLIYFFSIGVHPRSSAVSFLSQLLTANCFSYA
jgi:hypothetical protein